MTVDFLLDWMAEVLFQGCVTWPVPNPSLSLSDQEPFLLLTAFADLRRNSFPTFVSLNGTTVPKCKQISEHILLYPAHVFLSSLPPSAASSQFCLVDSRTWCFLFSVPPGHPFRVPALPCCCAPLSHVRHLSLSRSSNFPSVEPIFYYWFPSFKESCFYLWFWCPRSMVRAPYSVMDCARKVESEWV